MGEPAGERVFVALVPPLALRRELARRAGALLGPGHRALRAEELHLTLAYLGAVGSEGLGMVARAVEEAARRARERRPLELVLAGTGAFPDARRARVLWAGVREAAASEGLLAILRKDLLRALELGGARAAAEALEFSPHVSVARGRGARARPAPEAFLALELALAWRADALWALEARAAEAHAGFGRYASLARASLLAAGSGPAPATAERPARP